MADVNANTRKTPITLGVNRYILGDFSGFANSNRQLAVSVDLNGGTLTFTFQGRVPGATTWTNIRATPLSTGTVATGGTATENWQLVPDGLEIAINVTVATGSPFAVWG